MKALKITAAGLAAIAALSVGFGQGTARGETVYEDSPKFNCYVHGNRYCGDVLKIKRHGVKGAVLSKASDDRVYVSWKNGKVTHASAKTRYKAWIYCLDHIEDETDDGYRECDADYMEKGDMRRFARWDTKGI